MTQSMSTHSLFTVAPVLRCDRRELTERSRERKTSIRAKSNDPMTTNTIKQKFAQIRSRSATFGWKIINDWSFSLSSLLAYNLLISLLPMILCIFAVASLVFANDPDTMAEIRSRLLNAFPKAGLTEVLDALLASLSKQAGLVFIISFIVAIFTSSRLFIAIDDVLTIIYRIRERTILNQNIQAIKMLLAFVILTPFIIIVSSIPAVIRSNQIFYQFLISLFTGAVSFLLLNIIYRLVPLRKISWRNTWCGALVGAVGIQILILLFPLYVRQFMGDYVGQLGFIIITLLVFYMLGLLFVIGAQINAYFFEQIQPLPKGLGTCLSEFADRESVQLIDNNLRISTQMSTIVDDSN